MKKFYKLLAALLVVVLYQGVTPAKASHVMGSDISWECVGNDSFKITVTAYRDCNGIDLSGSGTALVNECTGASQSIGGTKGEAEDITPTCDEACTRCSDPGCTDTRFGIHKYEITTTIKIDRTKCCKWKITWGECCRNGAITTGAGNAGFHSEAWMDICNTPCNSSPYFTRPPVGIFCKGQCVVYNPGVNDKDMVEGEADSIVYRFGKPLQAAGTEIPFYPGYSHDQPLSYFGDPDKDADWDPNCSGFHLDPETGEIKFKPTKEEQTVVVIVVEEWRKDSTGTPKKISEIRRDLQIAVEDCEDNKAPIIVSEKYVYTFCANESKCITMNTFDLDKKDSVELNAFVTHLPGATFISETGKKWPKGTFCWKPTNGNVRTFPYAFVAEALDNFCPYPGRGNKTFSIYVKPAPEAQYTIKKENNCGEYSFSAVAVGRTPVTEFLWTGEVPPGDRPIWRKGSQFGYTYSEGGSYRITLTVTSPDGCKTTYVDSVVVPTKVKVDLPNDTTVCKNSTIPQILAKRMYGNQPYTTAWSTGHTNVSSLTNVLIDKDTFFAVNVWDGNNCWTWDTMHVEINELPRPMLGKDIRSCKGDTVKIDAAENLIIDDLVDAKYEWWNINDTAKKVFLTSDSIAKITDSGVYVVKVIDAIGCAGSDTINVFFNPLLDVQNQYVYGCKGQQITLDAGQFENPVGIQYEWYDLIRKVVVGTSRKLTVDAQRNRYTYRVCATQTIKGKKCTDCDEVDLEVRELPQVKITSIPAQCVDNPPLSLMTYVNLRVPPGKWTSPDAPQAIMTGGFFNPKLADSGLWTVVYTYEDTIGCKNSATAKISVDYTPNVKLIDTFICQDEKSYTLNNSVSANLYGGTWKVLTKLGQGKEAALQGTGNNRYYNLDVAGPGYHYLSYKYVGQTSAKCDDEDTMILQIIAVPTVEAGDDDEFCANEGPQELTSGTPVGGVWTSDIDGAVTLNAGTYYFNPQVVGEGVYELTYTYGKECPEADVVMYTVNPVPDATIDVAETDVCIDTEPIALSWNVSPGMQGNGSFSGKGVMPNGTFDPSEAGEGAHIITLTYTSTKTCSNTDQHTITVHPKPTIEVVTTPQLCEGSSYIIDFEISGGQLQVEANPDLGNVNGVVPIDENTIAYTPSSYEQTQGYAFTLTATVVPDASNPCGPVSTPVNFTINPKPYPAFTANKTSGCNPFVLIFTDNTKINSGSWQTSWDFGDGNTAIGKKVSHTYKQAGIYTVKMSARANGSGCDSVMTKVNYITVHQTPEANFIAEPTYTSITLPDIQFTSEGYTRGLDDNARFYWNFGDHLSAEDTSEEVNPKYSYHDTGQYTVTLMVVNGNGCQDTIIKQNYIYIQPELTVFIPNVFTPNGRYLLGSTAIKNEVFRILTTSVATFDLKIFNRWGELMYEGTDPEEGWDGNYKGKPAPEGVYMYVVKVQNQTGKEYKYTGTVTLLR